MSAGRWRVHRLRQGWAQPWVAIHENQGRDGYGPWRQFDTWREAYTYADKQARG